MNEEIQNLVKEQISDLLDEYDVSYIDFDATCNEYTIKLFKYDNERG